jgi:hypothetical protein
MPVPAALRRRPVWVALLTLGLLAVAVPASAHAAGPTPAVPAPIVVRASATNGKIAYTCLDHGTNHQRGWVVADADGSNPVFYPWTQGTFNGSAQWSPDGTELAHSASFLDLTTHQPQHPGIVLTEADGSYPFRLTNLDGEQPLDQVDSKPAWYQGEGVMFSRSVSGAAPDLRLAYLFGGRYAGYNFEYAPAPADLSDINASAVAYVANGSDIMLRAGGGTSKIGSGTLPKVAPDGTSVAYLDPGTHLIHTMTLAGADDQVAGGDGRMVNDLAWSPDGTMFLFSLGGTVWEQPVGGAGGILPMHPVGGGALCNGQVGEVSWQPVPAPKPVVRIAGADRVGTSVAVSRASFPTDHTADAVVLADSTHFPDALAGTPLAVRVNGPLLLTNGAAEAPDPRVLAEIGRVLRSTTDRVYLLGGTGAVSSGIETALNHAGYTTITRFAGTDRYDTALKIATFLGTGANAPRNIFLATGTDFPDGLAAGAAAAYDAGSNGGGVVLLTRGSTLPPPVGTYISDAVSAPAAKAVTVLTVGGMAAQAYAGPNEVPVVGADRYQTSELVAEDVFGAPSGVALAMGTSFPDALSGGAYAGAHYLPLVLAPPSLTTTGAVPTYLHTRSASIGTGVVFGGTGVVSCTVETQLGQAIALAATHTSVTPTGPGPHAC